MKKRYILCIVIFGWHWSWWREASEEGEAPQPVPARRRAGGRCSAAPEGHGSPLAPARHPRATRYAWIPASPASRLFPLQYAPYAGLLVCFLREKPVIYLLCFNLITMSNSFLPLCSGLEKDSIISTVARRLLPGHKILIRNNHAALKWEL